MPAVGMSARSANSAEAYCAGRQRQPDLRSLERSQFAQRARAGHHSIARRMPGNQYRAQQRQRRDYHKGPAPAVEPANPVGHGHPHDGRDRQSQQHPADDHPERIAADDVTGGGLIDIQVAREITQQTHAGELGHADGEPADRQREMHQAGADGSGCHDMRGRLSPNA
jgi:hypothetical protein